MMRICGRLLEDAKKRTRMSYFSFALVSFFGLRSHLGGCVVWCRLTCFILFVFFFCLCGAFWTTKKQ